MKYPPSRTRGLLVLRALQDGEASKTYRVRAPEPVHEWLASMTAEQRGELLTQVYSGSTARSAAIATEHEAMRRAWATGEYNSLRDLAKAHGWSKTAVGRVLKSVRHPNVT